MDQIDMTNILENQSPNINEIDDSNQKLQNRAENEARFITIGDILGQNKSHLNIKSDLTNRQQSQYIEQNVNDISCDISNKSQLYISNVQIQNIKLAQVQDQYILDSSKNQILQKENTYRKNEMDNSQLYENSQQIQLNVLNQEEQQRIKQGTYQHKFNQLNEQKRERQRTKSLQNSIQKQSYQVQQKNGFLTHKLKYIRKFVLNMKKLSKILTFKNLEETQFNMIGDVSAFYKYYIVKNYIQRKKEMYQNGIIIRDRKIIFEQNFWNMMKDLSIFIMYRISRYDCFDNQIICYLDYTVFIKYLSIPSKFQEFEIKLQLNSSFKNWIKLLRLELYVLMLAHISCCIYLSIGKGEAQNQINWITKNSLQDMSISQQYIFSLYYMIITITTTGYGDVYPTNNCERIFIMIVALIATNITAYSFSQISEIVSSESRKKEKINQEMLGINYQMKASGLSMNLQQKVRKFFEYSHFQNNKQLKNSYDILHQLPIHLQEEVLLEMNKDICQIQIFKNLSHEFQKKLILSIKQKQCSPDEIVINQQDNDQCFYYINQGDLEYQTILRCKDSQRHYSNDSFKLKKKDCFGYEGFLLQESSPYTVKSLSYSVISYIDRNHFQSILKEFPLDYEKFSYFKDKSIFDCKTQNIRLKCLSCGQNHHYLSKCPYITLSAKYKPDKQINHRNQNYLRRKEKKNNTFKNLNNCQEQAMDAIAVNDESFIYDAFSAFKNSNSEQQITEESESDTDTDQNQMSNIVNSNIINQIDLDPLKETKSSQQKNTCSSNQNSNKKSFFNSQQTSDCNIALESPIKEYQKGITLKFKSHLNFNQEDFLKQEYNEENVSLSQNQIILIQNQSLQPTSFQKDIQITNQSYNTNSKFLKSVEQIKSRDSIFIDEKNQNSEQSVFKKEDELIDKNTVSIQNNIFKQISSQNNNGNIFKEQEKELILLKQTFEKRQQRSKQVYEELSQNVKSRIQFQQIKDRITPQNSIDKTHDTLSPFQKAVSIISEQDTKDKSKHFLKQVYDAIKSAQQSQHQKPQSFQSYISQLDKKLDKKQTNQYNQSINNQNNTKSTAIKLNQLNVNSNFQDNGDNTGQNSNEEQQQLTEFKIRCQVNLQELDLLVVRKQYLLQQQKNLISDYIEVPDNELNIDIFKNYTHYYQNNNLKPVLASFRFWQLKKQRQNPKTQQSQKRKTKLKKTTIVPNIQFNSNQKQKLFPKK
ncbi:cyclic nucleotide-binding domain protein (macronuclear) [Tetrahymena thermophila SB210]|uniref:Cyclic nucleotide-binding domain protein n=1 Tax=Tetrahymena thermophila (strain SB210) TaxID=312017 RepID=Q22U32_TETTS|nr:cyclic nucleotide-binding domain protein [Tetrahymena thermophila SB210]EAR88855.2 cyclic nucleotide-binding domain protein [Tetrahymena thermophila SB210]|eukprot:XP_001009100.2 cyclic nucleotide-binding domain protein [Tetrahymena thermophila SB210]